MKRTNVALWSLVLAVGCAHAPPPAPAPLDAPLDAAPAPEAARAQAGQVADVLAAVDLAWILGNDRAAARTRLDAALVAAPRDPALLLRRARLAEAELREDEARRDLIAIIREAPASTEAAIAIARLTDDPGELTTRPGATSEPADAARAALLGAAPLPVMRVIQLAQLIARATPGNAAALDPAVLARAGLITEARVVGPLGPRTAAALITPTGPERDGLGAAALPHRGIVAKPRAAFVHRGDLLPVEGDVDGLYVVEAAFVLERAGPIALTVDLRALGRVRIDGAVVLDRGLESAIPPAVETVAVELSAGPHRLTVAMLAGKSDGLRLSILGLDGTTVLGDARALPSDARPAEARPLVARALPSDLLRALTDCTAPARASCVARDDWSVRAHLAELALGRAARDVEIARALVRTLGRAAPRSAVALTLEARLSSVESLPASRGDAALRRALTEDPTHPGLLLAVARQVTADDPEAAAALVDRARAAAPTAVDPELARFRLLQGRGWNAEAAASLDAVLARARRPSILEEAARFHRTLLQLSRARALEAELEQAMPTDGRAIAQALQRGEVDAAIGRLVGAAAERARSADLWARVAELELARARPKEALAATERALAIEPSDVDATRHTLVAARALGDLARARSSIERLRALGAADLEIELYAADLERRVVGPEVGPAADRLRVDPLALAKAPVDPRWSGAARVRLLDRLVEEVRADGSALSHHHQLVRLSTKDAADIAGEIRLPDGAVPLSLRTLKPDGRTIEVDRHAGKEDLSFSALAPGDTVEQEWIAVAGPATASGGYLRRFLFQTDLPTARAELVVVVPTGTRIWWKSYHGAPAPERLRADARDVYVFAARDVQGIPAEPAMAPIEEFLPYVVVAIGLDEAIALESNRAGLGAIARPSRDVTTLTASVTRGLTAPAAIVERVVRWVDANIRDGRGDATRAALIGEGSQLGLVTAMLRASGLDARLVLARGGRQARVEPPFPDPSRFGDVLVRVDLPDCAPAGAPPCRLWIDAASATLLSGSAPAGFRGGSYLVADPPGPLTEQRFEDAEVGQWHVRSRARLQLDAAGTLAGVIEVTLPGAVGAGVRRTFRPMRPDDIARGLQGWVSGILPGAELTDVRLGDLAPSPDDFTMTVEIRAAEVLGEEGGARVLRRFFEGPIGLRALGVRPLEAYLARSQRQMPMALDAAAETLEVEIRVAPELGAPADPPATFERKTPWATVSQRFDWDAAAHTARLWLHSELFAVRIPAADYPAFRAMAQEVTLLTRNRLALRR